MMKRVLLSLLALSLCVMLAVPVFAAPRNGVYILDELEHLDDDDFRSLHQEAIRVSEALGLDVILVFTYEENLEAYGQQLTIGQIDDQIIMLDNEEDWAIVCHGAAVKMTTSSDWDTLRRAYEEEVTYASAVEAYYATAEELLADREHPEEEYPEQMGSLVVDQAGLLTEAERTQLTEKLNGISHEHRMDVVLVTADDLGGKSPRDYADDFYDYNGYGKGPNYDGILLLVSMEDRDYWISTCGAGITAFTDAGIEYLAEQFLEPLSNGDYALAFNRYADTCVELLIKAEQGNPYDVADLPEEPFHLFGAIVISLGIGFLVAFIATAIMKGQLKSVRAQSGAADYVKKDSLKVTKRQDLFLYRQVTRRELPKSNSGGGSSVHRSSSGRSHGGGGGKF